MTIIDDPNIERFVLDRQNPLAEAQRTDVESLQRVGREAGREALGSVGLTPSQEAELDKLEEELGRQKETPVNTRSNLSDYDFAANGLDRALKHPALKNRRAIELVDSSPSGEGTRNNPHTNKVVSETGAVHHKARTKLEKKEKPEDVQKTLDT